MPTGSASFKPYRLIIELVIMLPLWQWETRTHIESKGLCQAESPRHVAYLSYYNNNRIECTVMRYHKVLAYLSLFAFLFSIYVLYSVYLSNITDRLRGNTNVESLLSRIAAKVRSMDKHTKNCPKVIFDPYIIKGLPVQVFRRELAVWNKSCMPLKFSETVKFPHTALASHPGSGNTWSRHLIQQLTGQVAYLRT